MRRGIGPARPFTKLGGAAAAFVLAAAPFPLSAADAAAPPTPQATSRPVGDSIADFYRSRGGRPLWLAQQSETAAQRLLELLRSSRADGLDPDRYQTDRIAEALRSARVDPDAVGAADELISSAFVAYARDLRRDPKVGIVYVDRELIPGPQSPRYLLERAAAAPSLEAYVGSMAWMNPTYRQLRKALAAQAFSTDGQRHTLTLNLERARALPADNSRHVVVNAAAQRLFMYENGQVVDSMRVVVGKPKYPTPMMNAYIRGAALNPYWNVPPDLAAERIAPNVVKQGVAYLTALGYEVLSDWGAQPTLVDPTTIDWKAVEEGRLEVRVRQLPGPHNALGQMKFVFPNAQGIFLHDTPDRELLNEAARLYSGGCIRLEDAPRFARWLFGRDLQKSGDAPEQIVTIPVLVPLYITYLTAVPEGSAIAYFDDVYGLDAARLAAVGSGQPALTKTGCCSIVPSNRRKM
jgi:murein L,D-transpeptidase YcbB/YkuD